MSLSLPRLCPEESKLQTLAGSVAENVTLYFAGQEQSVSIVADQDSINSPELTLSLLIDGHQFVVRFTKPPFGKKVLDDLGVVSFPDLPGLIQKSIVERVFDEDLSRLERWIGRNVEIGPDERQKNLPASIYFKLGEESEVFGEIAVAAEGIPILAGILDCLPRKVNEVGRIPISLGIEVGRTFLDLESVRGLESGDVVLIDSGPDLKNHQIEIRPSHSTVYRGRLRGAEVKIESYMSVDPDYTVEYDNAAEAETENLPAKRDAMTQIGDIPVNVVFELGRRQITVDDLDQIQPGAVIELENSIEDAKIVVRVNGKAIATGTLAEVGDKIAVRID